jgi:hypothetical protein
MVMVIHAGFAFTMRGRDWKPDRPEDPSFGLYSNWRIN